MVALQRGGHQFLDRGRGTKRLLRQLWKALTDSGGRSLPSVDLRKVASREDQIEHEAEIAGEGDEGGEKLKPRDVRSLVGTSAGA